MTWIIQISAWWLREILLHALFSILPLLFAFQIEWAELRLLWRRSNYMPQTAQFVSFFFAITMLCNIGMLGARRVGECPDLMAALSFSSVLTYGTLLLLPLVVFFFVEWFLARRNPRSAWTSWGVRFAVCLVIQLSPIASPFALLSYTLVGLYLRNNTFGIPHGKIFCIAHRLTQRTQLIAFDEMNYISEDERQCLPDTSFAGRKTAPDEAAYTVYDVTSHGILPNTAADLIAPLQQLIDTVGEAGGGIIYFPKGRYLFNRKGDNFLQINHSNVILEGELDSEGRPLATLVNCGKTSRGHKNPWISPFFITTGEALQPSNEFWGLQFRKRRDVVLRSNSLADPGSDGTILSPDVTTVVTASSTKGSTLLKVKDARSLSKYVLIGLYNTTPSGNLIRDILGVDELREEWTVARRAGEEEAPSYQWLVEVKRVIDDETIELVRPLLRDIDMAFEPVVCNVDLLENIVIRNLHIDSTWNGQFRHHGFPLYYNIKRTQEMDYGWNAINLKRCAHSEVKNVVITNFTNPLYVLDSRNVTVHGVEISGYDGHQGLKAYMHTCDCLFEDITFRAHFADMMGGEGTAYANLFRRISYLNPVFKPVEYDFHGFASESMSPPSDNMFTQIYGFRYFKSAGSITHLPSLARRNVWWNIKSEGEHPGDPLFYAMTYREKKGLTRIIFAVGYAVAMVQKSKNLSPSAFVKNVRWKLHNIDEVGFERSTHKDLFFPDNHVYGIRTTGRI